MAGTLVIPTTFATLAPPTQPFALLDTALGTIVTYINPRELSFGLLSARPVAGTHGAGYFATDVGILYGDNGATWVQLSSAATPALGTIVGLTLSNDGVSPNTVLDIAAGAAPSDDATIANRILMTLPVAYTKNMNAAWVVGSGNGGNNAGAALGASVWYDVFLIERPDTGVVDVLCDTTLTPSLPAGYTKKHRLGSFLTDGANHILAFIQDGDFFQWLVPVLDINSTNPGVAAVTAPLTVPARTAVQALLNAQITSTTPGAHAVLFSDLGVTDSAPQLTTNVVAQIQMSPGIAGAMGAGQLRVRTTTARQIRFRCTVSDAATIVSASTVGWYDRRGQDS